MTFRISPVWWPLLGAASPLLAPVLLKKNRIYRENIERSQILNNERINSAVGMNLPELDFLEITVLVEEKTKDGFLGDAGVSYIFKSNLGTLLFDVGFGPERPALLHNANKIGFRMDMADALVISHLHPDHMGGMKASRSKKVVLPDEMLSVDRKDCYLPDLSEAEGFDVKVMKNPMLLKGGIATTGPLSRSLFFFGLTEEQALVAKVKDKGLVVITGCGHPTIEVILKMVRKMSDEKIYAICGGLHFPVTEGRGNKLGIQFQRFIGTGLPPWKELTNNELSNTISALNSAAPEKVYLSAHDSCDNSIKRFEKELNADTIIFRAGETYPI